MILLYLSFEYTKDKRVVCGSKSKKVKGRLCEWFLCRFGVLGVLVAD